MSSGEFHTSCCGGSFGARPRNPIGTPLVLRVLGKKKEKKLQPRFRCQQTSHGSYESSTHALLNCGSSVHTHSEVTEKVYVGHSFIPVGASVEDFGGGHFDRLRGHFSRLHVVVAYEVGATCNTLTNTCREKLDTYMRLKNHLIPSRKQLS